MKQLRATAVVVLTACSPRPDPVVVSRIILNAPAALDNRTAEREAIRAGVVSALGRDGGTRYSPDDRQGTHVLLLEIASVSEVGDSASGAQRVRVRLRPVNDATLFETSGEAPKGQVGQAAVLAAFADAWAVIARERVADAEAPRALVAALSDSDARLRLFAIQRLGERRVKEAVEPLMKLLTEATPPDVALRAIGALVVLADQRAAAPMIELAHNKDPAFVLQIVFALGALGGLTAEGYLVTLASGHPVEAVRRGAEDALAEMQRRKGDSARGGARTP